MRKLVLGAIVLVVLIGWFFLRKGAALEQAGLLKIGICPDYPPFEYKNEQGEIVGFDIDVVDALMQELQEPFEIVAMPFEMLMPQVQMGSISLLVSGLTATPERAKRILLSRSYTPQEPLVLLTKDAVWKPHTLEDFVGKRIIVNYGHQADALLQKYKEIEAVRTPSAAEALMSLRYHKADGFLVDFQTAKRLQLQEPGLTIVTLEYPAQAMVIGIAPHQQHLLERINNALDTLEREGRLEALWQKWDLKEA